LAEQRFGSQALFTRDWCQEEWRPSYADPAKAKRGVFVIKGGVVAVLAVAGRGRMDLVHTRAAHAIDRVDGRSQVRIQAGAELRLMCGGPALGTRSGGGEMTT
jgi:hypothetical protein